jgi:hypothetical protein
MQPMRTALSILGLALLAACSHEQLYNVGQGWQRAECQKLQDAAERSRCEKSTATSYERYRTESEAARHAPAR